MVYAWHIAEAGKEGGRRQEAEEPAQVGVGGGHASDLTAHVSCAGMQAVVCFREWLLWEREVLGDVERWYGREEAVVYHSAEQSAARDKW